MLGSGKMHKRVPKDTANIIFHLDNVMKKRGFTKNKLCVETGLRFETIQGYYLGNISRIDLYVLSELCRVLECEVSDIITYVPDIEKTYISS